MLKAHFKQGRLFGIINSKVLFFVAVLINAPPAATAGELHHFWIKHFVLPKREFPVTREQKILWNKNLLMTAMKTEPAEPMIKSDFGAYGSPYCSPGPRYSPHQNLGPYSAYPYISPSPVAVAQTNSANDYWAWNQVCKIKPNYRLKKLVKS